MNQAVIKYSGVSSANSYFYKKFDSYMLGKANKSCFSGPPVKKTINFYDLVLFFMNILRKFDQILFKFKCNNNICYKFSFCRKCNV